MLEDCVELEGREVGDEGGEGDEDERRQVEHRSRGGGYRRGVSIPYRPQ